MLQSMIQSSPQAGEIMSILNKHGGDARAAFYDAAQQKGIDPNVIINMLK